MKLQSDHSRTTQNGGQVLVHVRDGLGNQLFQYAAGRALSIRSGQPLVLDTEYFRRNSDRIFGLPQFNVRARIAEPGEIPLKPRNDALGRLRALYVRLHGIRNHVREKSMAFDPGILQMEGGTYLYGLWQSEKYFAAISDVIRDDLSLSSPFTPPRRAMMQKISASNAISIHVRRGDYVSNAYVNSSFGVMPRDWYAKAMSVMAERFPDAEFYVFSDDPGWVRENLTSSLPMTFVDPMNDGMDGQDMHLMAACRAHVIANSTFSWWGAWLNPNTDKHVIAPAQWFRSSDHDTRDLVPPEWQRL